MILRFAGFALGWLNSIANRYCRRSVREISRCLRESAAVLFFFAVNAAIVLLFVLREFYRLSRLGRIAKIRICVAVSVLVAVSFLLSNQSRVYSCEFSDSLIKSDELFRFYNGWSNGTSRLRRRSMVPLCVCRVCKLIFQFP